MIIPLLLLATTAVVAGSMLRPDDFGTYLKAAIENWIAEKRVTDPSESQCLPEEAGKPCCRSMHRVNLKEIPGLDHVLAPRTLAYFMCNDSCSNSLLEVVLPSSSARKCGPAFHDPLKIVYTTGASDVVVTRLSNFFARDCGCR